MKSQLDKCKAFAALHERDEAWVIPNPWDAGSAKLLAGLGFEALATTSGGYAFTQGKQDGAVTLEETLQHCTVMSAATEVPLSADFENGFSDDSAGMAANIKRLALTGVAGFSIEDYSRERRVIYPLAEAAERIRLAVTAIAASGVPLVLTARAEGLLRGQADLDEIVERLLAYSEAGAQVLYAPALCSLKDLQYVTDRLHKPCNALASFFRGVTVTQLAAAGAIRISVGGALTYATLQPLLLAGREMLEQGSFNWIEEVANGREVRSLMGLL